MAHGIFKLLVLSLLIATPNAWAQSSDKEAPKRNSPLPAAYTPRSDDSYNLLRIFDKPNLAQNIGEFSFNGLDQSQRYLQELTQADDWEAQAQSPNEARIFSVDLGATRNAYYSVPALPAPPEPDALFPGNDYDPRYYYLQSVNSVRASATLQPRSTLAGWHPTFAMDIRAGLQGVQGTTEMMIRFALDKTLSDVGSGTARLIFWGGFENKTVGLLEPVPLGLLGAGMLFPRAKSFTKFSFKGMTLGNGDFYNASLDLNVSHDHSLLNNLIMIHGAVNYQAATVDAEQYMAWRGVDEVPFEVSHALDGDVGVIAKLPSQAFFQLDPKFHLGYAHTLMHREDAFLDGFYRPTGARIYGAASLTLQRLAEFNFSISQSQYSGYIPRPTDWEESAPPIGSTWATQITVGALGRF